MSLACNIDSEIEAGDVFDFSLKDVLYVGFDEVTIFNTLCI